MLSFPSKNNKTFFSDWTGVLKKSDQGDAKPTYFYTWSRSSHMCYAENIKPIHIKKLLTGLQCPYLSKFSHFQNLHICRFDSMRISPSLNT